MAIIGTSSGGSNNTVHVSSSLLFRSHQHFPSVFYVPPTVSHGNGVGRRRCDGYGPLVFVPGVQLHVVFAGDGEDARSGEEPFPGVSSSDVVPSEGTGQVNTAGGNGEGRRECDEERGAEEGTWSSGSGQYHSLRSLEFEHEETTSKMGKRRTADDISIWEFPR